MQGEPREMDVNAINVSRVYQTIVDKGKNAGRPAIFFELCKEGGKKMTAKDIIDIISKGILSRLIVFNGYEPLMQQSALGDAPKSILHEIRKSKITVEGLQVEVHTNGDTIPTQNMYWNTDYFTIIPKEFTKESAARVDAFCENALNICTLLIEVNRNKKELEKKLNWSRDNVKHMFQAHEIFLCPIETTVAEVKKTAKWITATCITHGFRLSPRFQIWMGVI